MKAKQFFSLSGKPILGINSNSKITWKNKTLTNMIKCSLDDITINYPRLNNDIKNITVQFKTPFKTLNINATKLGKDDTEGYVFELGYIDPKISKALLLGLEAIDFGKVEFVFQKP